jgi:hypothetical protein
MEVWFFALKVQIPEFKPQSHHHHHQKKKKKNSFCIFRTRFFFFINVGSIIQKFENFSALKTLRAGDI